MRTKSNRMRTEVEEIDLSSLERDGIRLAVCDKVSQEGSDFEMLVAFLATQGISDEGT